MACFLTIYHWSVFNDDRREVSLGCQSLRIRKGSSWITVSEKRMTRCVSRLASHLLNTNQRTISPMISTVDVRNGFREDLLPMVFTSTSDASEGLRNAILALCSFHLGSSEEALPYKQQALLSLSKSFESESVSISETQLATFMMLCVYSVSQGFL